MMDIQTFQDKLNELKKLASQNEKKLTGEQVKTFFEGLNPDREQLLQILTYLKTQGIAIEGMEMPDNRNTEAKDQGLKKLELTAEEKGCLREYRQTLTEKFEKDKAEHLFEELATGSREAKAGLAEQYMEVAADIAVSLYAREMMLGDLLQEANVCLLMALEKEEPVKKDDAWLRAEIRKGIKEVLEAQTQQNFADDCLVAKVENLESAVRDLSEGEDGEESKFSVGELAIILDMEIEEIQDILRLTGDYSSEN